eukprot:12200931-Alexandrium_andersonii.AAC.1
MAAVELRSANAADLVNDLKGVADALGGAQRIWSPAKPALERTCRRLHPTEVAVGRALPSH